MKVNRMKITEALSTKIANMAIVCSILIVCIHTTIEVNAKGVFLWYFRHYMTLSGVVAIAVPFFFIASGFFLAMHMDEKGWYREAIRKRLRSLGIPYLFWNLFYLIFTLSLVYVGGLCGIPFGNSEDFCMSPLRVAEIFGLNPLKTPELPFLWYVRSLILFVLVAPIFRKVSIYGVGFFFSIYFILDVLFLLPTPWGTLSHWFIPLRGLAYFSLGIYLQQHQDFIPTLTKWKSMLYFAIGTSVYFLGLSMSITFEGTLSRAFIWMSTPLLLLSIWGIVPSKIWPTWFTRCAFPMYLMHFALITLFIGVLRAVSLKVWGYSTLLGWFLRLGVVVIVAIICINIVYICFPRIARLIFGGRG